MKKPKLALIPSAYADGKVISVMPTNGSGDFDFTRGSGATRINKDGLIETIAEELGDELITNGSFAADSDWNKGAGWTISGGSLNGSNTGNTAFQEVSSLTSGKTYQVTYTISNFSSGNVRVELGFGNVSVGATNSSNGTYTEVIKALADTYFYFDGGSFTGSIDNVSVKEVISGYDTPRLDYPMIDGVVSGCPSLLLEPQRTNLLPYSEYVSSWSTTQATVTENYAISPEGVLNATRLVGTGTDFIRQDNIIANPSNKTFTSSFWAKNNGGDANISVQMNSSGVSTYAKGIALTNEWQRFDFTQSYAGTDTGSLTFRFRQTNSIDCLVYGFQLEEGSYPTSYIPTNGSAVTRLAEVCNGSGDASTFNDSEGVLMAEISALADDGTNRNITINDNTSDNVVLLKFDNSSNAIEYRVLSSGTLSVAKTATVSDTTLFNKVSVKYKQNDFALWINGFKMGTDTVGSTPIGLIKLDLSNYDEANKFYGKTKQLQYFQTALTDSELEELTSWDSFKVMAIAQLYNIE